MRTVDDLIIDLGRPQSTRDLRDIVLELARITKLIEESLGIDPVLLNQEPATAASNAAFAFRREHNKEWPEPPTPPANVARRIWPWSKLT